MLLEKLHKIEIEIKYTLFKEQKKMNAVKSIKELLNEIDYRVEEVPAKSKENLMNLLKVLKGKELTEEEVLLIEKLTS